MAVSRFSAVNGRPDPEFEADAAAGVAVGVGTGVDRGVGSGVVAGVTGRATAMVGSGEGAGGVAEVSPAQRGVVAQVARSTDK